MNNPDPNRSIQFFDTQFKRQIASHEFDLNPFEQAILPFVHGDALDLGCGLGNLAIAVARQGASVLALDASASAIDALRQRALADRLPVVAETHDLAAHEVAGDFDTVLCVGLLMFFPPEIAHGWVERIKNLTRVNGIAAINVLIEGTSYLDMFEPDRYTLFSETALQDAFRDWKIEYGAVQEFKAPGDTLKRFSTLVARKV